MNINLNKGAIFSYLCTYRVQNVHVRELVWFTERIVTWGWSFSYCAIFIFGSGDSLFPKGNATFLGLGYCFIWQNVWPDEE